MISSEKKAEIVAKYGKDAKDTGSLTFIEYHRFL